MFFLIQPIKSQNFSLPSLKYQLKNKYPPLAKNVTKGYHSIVTYVYHFCEIILITASAIFCSVKFHVVCTCTFFGDRLPPDKAGNDHDSTYCIDTVYDC
jgi:hypothetical protein